MNRIKTIIIAFIMKNIKSIIIALIIIGGLIIIRMWAAVSTKEEAAPPKSRQILTQEFKEEVFKEKTPVPPEVRPEERPVLVRTYKLKRKDFRDPLSVMGTVKGSLEIDLRFEINGVVNTINFREGEKVKKGDIITTLEDKDGRLRLEYAGSKLKAAQAAYETSKKKQEIYQGLYDAGAIIKAKLEEVSLESENARLQMETVKTELKLAQSELDKTKLRAMRDGIMGSRDVEVGEFVTPNTKVAVLVVTDEVYVEVGIIERDIDKIRLGQKAEVNVDAYPAEDFIGEVDNISPLVEGRSRTLTAKIKVANPQGLLLPGMFARCQILLAEFKNAIIVPTESLIAVGPQAQVVPVVTSKVYSQEDIESGAKPGELELREVTVEYQSTDYAYISSGLSDGELVIIEAQGELKDGVKLKVVGVEEATF